MSFIKEMMEKREFDLKKRELELEVAEKNIGLRLRAIELDVKQHHADTLARGYKEINDYECVYHNAMEEKRTELARLDALIEAKKAEVVYIKDAFQDRLIVRDNIITTLQETIKVMSQNMGANTKIEVIK